jgi:hypothetical protein
LIKPANADFSTTDLFGSVAVGVGLLVVLDAESEQAVKNDNTKNATMTPILSDRHDFVMALTHPE